MSGTVSLFFIAVALASSVSEARGQPASVPRDADVVEWTAEEYWQAYAMSGQQLERTFWDVLVLPDVVTGMSRPVHKTARFWISRDRLGDLARQRGFIKCLDDVVAMRGQPSTANWAQTKIEDLTGLTGRTDAEWKQWLTEHRDYLVWSERLGHFVVDQPAKDAGMPTATYRAAYAWPHGPP